MTKGEQPLTTTELCVFAGGQHIPCSADQLTVAVVRQELSALRRQLRDKEKTILELEQRVSNEENEVEKLMKISNKLRAELSQLAAAAPVSIRLPVG